MQLESQLDKQEYDSSRLISIKVPSARLAYANSGQYERVDGKVEISGIQYMFVKRRLFNDTLELICIPNHTAKKVGQARTDSHPAPSKPFSTDYYTLNDFFRLTGLIPTPLKGASNHFILLPHIFLFTDEHPPPMAS